MPQIETTLFATHPAIKGSNMIFHVLTWSHGRCWRPQFSTPPIHALTFARSHGRCWKPRPKAAVFNTSQGTWRMIIHWKTMFDCYYCIKTENICYISRYFLNYFVLPFPWCHANTISTDYAQSRAGQYTSCDGSNSVAPVRAYWKLRSHALTAPELSC